MKHIEGEFKGFNDLKIYFQGWLPENKPKSIIIIVHAFAEHSGRYKNIVNKLIPLNYAVYAHDLRGHGKSEGLKNYVDSMDQFVEDLKKFYDIIKEKSAKLPIFMLGHSFGSLIIVYFTKKYENLLNGIILAAMGIRTGGKSNSFMRVIAKIFSKLAPRISVNPGLNPEFLSHDLDVIEDYKNDPLVNYKKITARLGYIMIKSFRVVTSFINELKLPMLMQCGSEDHLIYGAEEIKEMFKMDDKVIKIYDGLYHEVYNESEIYRKEVLADLSMWLEEHL
jgi:alpha-beta hydrolase superfamily lysophospholipase